MRRLALISVALLLAACGGDSTTSATTTTSSSTSEVSTTAEPADRLPTEACDDAMAAAASVDEMQDTVDDLYPVAQACESLADWTAASQAHPDALDDIEPEIVATNICLYGDGVAGSRLCQELGR